MQDGWRMKGCGGVARDEVEEDSGITRKGHGPCGMLSGLSTQPRAFPFHPDHHQTASPSRQRPESKFLIVLPGQS